MRRGAALYLGVRQPSASSAIERGMVECHTDLMWELLSFGEAAMGMSLYATCSFLVVGYEYISVAA
ncbi:hypothetical protein DVQ53_22240, partial [Yersinia enterocolitica]|nr:hypothetical protein [Yersinia enterocolitica]